MITSKVLVGAAISIAILIVPAFANAIPMAPAQDAPALIPLGGKMPDFSAETLAERKVQLPRDLPGGRTLVLVTFERAQEKNLDTWVVGLALLKSPIAWVVTPVIDKQNAFVQAMITGGMRLGTSDLKERDNTIPLFTSQKDFIAALQLKSGQKTNYAVIVDRGGQVWAVAEGDYNPEKAKSLLAAISALAQSGGK